MDDESGAAALNRLVTRLTSHTALPKDASKALTKTPYGWRTLDPGQIAQREGDEPHECHLLMVGFAMRQKIVSGGRRQILSIDMAGDFVGLDLLFIDKLDYNVQALSSCVVLALRRDALADALERYPPIARAFSVELAREAAIYREWLANMGSRDPRTRVAHLLCEIGLRLERAKLAERSSYELPLTQEQLADTLGLSLIHTSRTLKALEQEGLIERSRRSIRVNNWDRLRSAGDFSASYLGPEPASDTTRPQSIAEG